MCIMCEIRDASMRKHTVPAYSLAGNIESLEARRMNLRAFLQAAAESPGSTTLAHVRAASEELETAEFELSVLLHDAATEPERHQVWLMMESNPVVLRSINQFPQ